MQCSAARVLFSPDNAVGALAQLLSHVVALVNNKLLVEDLEDLAVREVRHGGGGCGLRLLCSCSCLLVRAGRRCAAGSWGAGGDSCAGRRRLLQATTASECLRQGEMRRRGKARQSGRSSRRAGSVQIYRCGSKDGDGEQEVGTE